MGTAARQGASPGLSGDGLATSRWGPVGQWLVMELGFKGGWASLEGDQDMVRTCVPELC